jgi:hypothetical protein
VAEPTLDPAVVIVARGIDAGGAPFVSYQHADGRRWIVRGACNQCGLCVVGAAHPEHYRWHGEPGTPGAVTDLRVAAGRLDEPIAPHFAIAGCVLRVEVLD